MFFSITIYYIIISIIVCKIRIDNSLLLIIITYSKIEFTAKNTYEIAYYYMRFGK